MITPTTPPDARKARHAIMRKLQRADWAMQEDDSEDALMAALSAVRMAAKLDPYEELPEHLPAILGRAVAVCLDCALGDRNLANVLRDAAGCLVLPGENFRGCDYGM